MAETHSVVRPFISLSGTGIAANSRLSQLPRPVSPPAGPAPEDPDTAGVCRVSPRTELGTLRQLTVVFQQPPSVSVSASPTPQEDRNTIVSFPTPIFFSSLN